MSDDLSHAMTDAVDHEILMHRDAHFSGSFALMLAYYEKEGKGAHPECGISRIEELKRLEEEYGENLAELVLSDGEKHTVLCAKDKYLMLRAICEGSADNPLATAIAHLILAEEEDPSQEIAALVALGAEAVPSLISLLRNPDFYSPFFPGYGEAPALAARCLGLIGDERAISPLFDAMEEIDFFIEEAILQALVVIGDRAKRFLLNTLQTLPITADNERAAIALLGFPEEEELSQVCLNMLKEPTLSYRSAFAAYLAMGCQALAREEDRKQFIQLAQRDGLPLDLKHEMDVIIQKWKLAL